MELNTKAQESRSTIIKDFWVFFSKWEKDEQLAAMLAESRKPSTVRRRRKTGGKGNSNDHDDQGDYGEYEPRRFGNTSGNNTNRRKKTDSRGVREPGDGNGSATRNNRREGSNSYDDEEGTGTLDSQEQEQKLETPKLKEKDYENRNDFLVAKG